MTTSGAPGLGCSGAGAASGEAQPAQGAPPLPTLAEALAELSELLGDDGPVEVDPRDPTVLSGWNCWVGLCLELDEYTAETQRRLQLLGAVVVAAALNGELRPRPAWGRAELQTTGESMSEYLVDLRRPALGGNGPLIGLVVHCLDQPDHQEPGKPFICAEAYLTDTLSGMRRLAYGKTVGEALERGERVSGAYLPGTLIPLSVQIGAEPIPVPKPPLTTAGAQAMVGPRSVRFHFGRGTITGLVTAIGDDLVRLDSVEPDEKPVIFSASAKGWDAEVLSNLEYAIAQRDAHERAAREAERIRQRDVPLVRTLQIVYVDHHNSLFVLIVAGPTIRSEFTRRELDYHTDGVKPWLQARGWRREALCTIDGSRIIVHAWVGEEIAPPPSAEPVAAQSAQTDDEPLIEPTDDPDSEALDDVTEHA